LSTTPDRFDMRSDLSDEQHQAAAGEPGHDVEGTRPVAPDQGRSGVIGLLSNALISALAAAAAGVAADSLLVGLALFAVLAVALALVIRVISGSRR